MSPTRKDPFLLKPRQLRWKCDPRVFDFRTTDELEKCPIQTIGQGRALEALQVGLSVRGDGYNIFVVGEVGGGRSTVVRRTLAAWERGEAPPDDLVFVQNFQDEDEPRKLIFPAGRGRVFRAAMEELVYSLATDLPRLFESAEYRKRRSELLEAAAKEQKVRFKEFEKQVQEKGFALVQVQMGPLTRPQLVPVVTGNPVDMDQLESLVEEGQFKREDLDQIQSTLTALRAEMEGLGKSLRNLDREARRHLTKLDRGLARPLVEEAVAEVRESFSADGLERYLNEIVEDVLLHLDVFRDVHEPTPEEDESPPAHSGDVIRSRPQYDVNLVVDNSDTKGRPVIWETAPGYRNLFGTIEKTRTGSGDWEADHTRIKGGSLLRANGGVLVLDAIDMLVEPGVWTALKRTLRNRTVEVQSYDPLMLFSGVSLKPEAIPIDLKMIIIGTRHIYRLLYALDEDFKKIFKVKAELAMQTDRSDEELQNYACFVHKKVGDDGLPPFHRDAVAAVVEHGVRLSGTLDKLTTRFTEIADVIRESGYWAARENSRVVKTEHVDQAIRQRGYRVNLTEELMREQIADGTVLIDVAGEKVGQVNGLAVLDLGDHQFAQPSRITVTTAMGRAGIIDIDRESEMSGSIHTKGVLILTGFLRSRFAQDHPLTLSASLCFEQNYGGVDGDSASSAELYALLSSLTGVPIRQGIAVTGSVNQRGEIQPIGGVNKKIEGFYDLCRLGAEQDGQGVLIPTRNVQHLMLRKDVVDAVKSKKFFIWAVSTIDEGVEVLTGRPGGSRGADGKYPKGSVFALAETRLRELAEQVERFGPADVRRL